MKAIVLLALIVGTQAFAAKVESGTVLKEVWTCKSTAKETYVDAVKVTVDNVKNTTAGALVDGTMSSEDIALSSADKSDLHKLEGGVNGHDSRDYSVQLVPSSSDVFDSYSSEVKTTGQAVVIYGGFIDCVGDVSGAEVLSCDVELVRSK